MMNTHSARMLRLLDVVGGEKHRAALAVEVLDHGPGLAAAERVKTGGGLVQDHQLRVVAEGDRDLKPVLLASRELLSATVGGLSEVDQRQQRRRVGLPAVEVGEQPQGLGAGEVVVESALLKLNPDPAPGLGRFLPEHLDLPGIGPAQPLDDLHGGGLAGAVGAEQGDYLAALDLQVKAPDRLHRAVALAQPPHPDRRSGVSRAATILKLGDLSILESHCA
jgi:hypothetical protein